MENELIAYVNFKNKTGYQPIYSSQVYGCFFIVYAKINAVDKTSYYTLKSIDLKIINYKGPFNIGITRAEYFELNEAAEGGRDLGCTIRLELKAMHESKKKNLKVLNIDKTQKFPVDGGLLLVDRRMKMMHAQPGRTKINDLALQNNIFDSEFFYREGPLSDEQPAIPKKDELKPLEWDDEAASISNARTMCPRSKMSVV